MMLERNGYTEETFFSYSHSPIRDDDGKIAGLFQICYDETELVAAQRDRERTIAELELERTNLTAIVEDAPAFIAVLRGPTHIFELANERYYELIGRYEDVLGNTVATVLPEVVGQGFINLLDTVYQTGETFFGTETPVTVGPPGALEHHYVNFVYQAMRKLDGGISGIFVHGVDVTAAINSRTNLESVQRQRRLALDAAELGSWHIDSVTLALTSDDRFLDIFGMNGIPCTYENAFAAIHPEDRERVRVAVEASMNANNPLPYAAEYRVAHPDGSIRWVFGKGRPNVDITAGNSTLLSLDGTVADITDRKQIEAERERLLDVERVARADAETTGRIKDEFLATLSHEIRTPLNAILGWSHIMQTTTNPDDVANGLVVIERNARAQARIVEDLLDMSSIISGKVRLDVQRLNLASIVSNAVDTARPTAQTKNIRLESIIDPMHGVEISGDANRLQQVLWNLLTNAIKFTPKGGEVRVLLERVNSHVEISIIDTGEGISAEFLPFAFDRFRQADASTTRRHGGLGIGLSIVRQLIELHGGTVRVKSPGLQMGSTFIVALPLMVVAPSAELATRQHPRVSNLLVKMPKTKDALAQLRVLVVDDEPDARALVKRLLEKYGAVVTTTPSAIDAIEHVISGTFDIVVSDIGMPDEDGYSLIRKIRQLSPAQHGAIPAIALTAYARAEDRVRAIAAGFQMHVVKPVEPIELITMVASAAGRRIEHF
jgi:PAS domain S-box-containing protein